MKDKANLIDIRCIIGGGGAHRNTFCNFDLLVVGFTQRSAEIGKVSASDCGIPVVFLPVSERELKSLF